MLFEKLTKHTRPCTPASQLGLLTHFLNFNNQSWQTQNLLDFILFIQTLLIHASLGPVIQHRVSTYVDYTLPLNTFFSQNKVITIVFKL